jgi:NAD(P)-dependent dehydrogenase (short-subunit alcohol dehydrogenase family)
MDLQGKVALVTGGAVRVGRAIVLALADSGADIVLIYNASAAEAAATCAEVVGRGRQALAHRADIAQVAEAQGMVAAAVERFGRLDILVNSASVWTRTRMGEVDEATWDRVTGVALKGSFFAAQAAAPHLAAHGEGLIVNVVDASVFQPFPNHIVHTVAKAGLLNMTYALALELAPGVRVNAVAPGPVLPPPGSSPAETLAAAHRTLLGRWGRAADVAQAVVYLAQADYVTGIVLPVDGGQRLSRR